MNDTQRTVAPRTTYDLANLDRSPSHRGTVERIDETGITGWCLSASDPVAPVALDILIADEHVATTHALRERGDVGEALGRSVSPGFEFRWIELTEARREALAARLRTIESTAPAPVTLRVAGSELELDDAPARKAGVTGSAQLLKVLDALATRPRISHIAAREAYLKSLPPRRTPSAEPRVRALAFYLPQFHPIPENDEWWGKGFTEWTNVSAAKPLFDGHDQPRFPAELGYYDLRTPGVIEAQIELAKSHGLAGFCFHHYWFGGQRLLQYPLERFLEIDHDFGFCICWANEPWSRRWDGSEHEVLMPQPHSLESDTQFIRDTLPILQDRRYLRVDGKPILIVYRVGLFKQPRVVFDRWREICIAAGLPGLHVCMAETFGSRNPWDYGCDSAVEFPPHAVSARQLTESPGAVEGLDPRFKGQIYDYAEVVANQVLAASPEYPRYQTVMLGWDNTSRRGLNGHIFRGFTLGAFEAWLEHACQASEREFAQDARLVFINAWNEWGEGTYLEPDRRHGRRYLESVKRVVFGDNAGDATFSVLEQRLQGDAPALAALDRVRERIRTLESTLGYAIENGRQRSAYATLTAVSTREPPGCNPRNAGGRGHIDHIGVRNGTGRRVARRGEIVHLSGWATPLDRPLTAHTPAFLRLEHNGHGGTPYFGAILSRVQREDVVQHFANNVAPSSPAAEAMPTALERVLNLMRAGPTPTSAPACPAPASNDHLWSGFTSAFSTESLPPGRYSVSIVFPVLGAGQRTAVDVRFDSALEVVE